ncbi:uncharacterized protein JCM6883_003527 [Sporobolomyces salmoneus]|uniref:uncharacterized protein n=1 Tax=Sporobolomyces salmoneus TaxID=183962 RepID=UPI00316C55F6
MPTSRLLHDPPASEDLPYSFASIPAFHLAQSRPSTLLPSPRMIRSGSTKENAPTSPGAISTRKKKPLPSSGSISKPTRPNSLGRRVVFSPTPLPSLQASPKHKRPFSEYNMIGGGGMDRPAKRLRRLGVYSNHPFLGLGTSERDGSSSPEEEEGEDKSSPPTTPEEYGDITPAFDKTGGGGSHGYFRFPFTLPGLTPPDSSRKPQARRTELVEDKEAREEDETDTATDSESESNFVSSLLLHRLPSSSSSISSSSPIRSPCTTFQQLPRRPSSCGSTWLKGILKPVVGGTPVLKALNEKEGTRKNGRGRKHVIGWEDMRIVEAEDADAAGKEGKGAEGKSVTDETRTDGEGKTRSARASGSNSVAKQMGDQEEDGDEEKGKKRKGITGGQTSSAGGSELNLNSTTTSRSVAREDPWLLRSPLLILKASLRPVSATHVRPPTASTSHLAPLLEPRSSPLAATEDTEMLVETDSEEEEFTNLFETPTFLTDVESAYVDLTRAIFQLPTSLSDPETTLEPLRSFRKTFVRCLARDLENIVSFPSWVKLSTPTSSPTSSASGSSATSSPTLGAGNALGSKDKKSLTEEQMRRLRDEIGVAQAAMRCATAVMRDARIFAIFSTQELTSLVRLITSLPTSPNLNNLAQRDMFTFVAFLLQDQALPREVLTPLIDSHILPALSALLALPHRADRHRIVLGEALSAVLQLLTTHPKEMIRGGKWKCWFKGSILGLWDGHKKGISVKGRSLKLAGRLIKCLTSPIEWTLEGMEWVKERESISRQVGETMLALLNEIPEDPLQGKKIGSTRLQLLSQQWTQMSKSKTGASNSAEEATILFHSSLLTILPALLGSSFRKIEEKGIAPWLKPYNQLFSSQQSIHILAPLTLSWTHLAYAFFRSTSAADEVESSWILRRRGHENKALTVLSNKFKTRQELWLRGDGGGTPTKKERKRIHAKALSITYAATLHGLTVSIFYGFSSVRDVSPEFELSTSTSDQLANLDEEFDRLVTPYLPSLTRSPFVDTSRIGWSILASILRPRTATDRFATLEDIVNPSLLDVQLASARTTEFLDFALATIFAKAFDPSKLTGWGSEWVQSRLGNILDLCEACATSSPLLAENYAGPVWTSLLASLASNETAVADALEWLRNLGSSTKRVAEGFSRDLWIATISSEDTRVQELVGEFVNDYETSQMIFDAWARTTERPDRVTVSLARGWTRFLLDSASTISIDGVKAVMSLLRHYVNTDSLLSSPEDFDELATALSSRLWGGEYPEIEEQVRILLRPPGSVEDTLKLCTLFLSTSHDLPSEIQTAVVNPGVEAVESVLHGDRVRDDLIPLIANMLSAASNNTYSVLYEAALDSIATRRPSSDALLKFVPLLTPSLDRALDFHAEAVVEDDATQLETFAPRPHLEASLHPLLAFNKFWRKTYGQTSLDIVYPPDLLSRLHLVRGLAQDIMETQPQDSQLYSQLEESVRTFSSADERARAQAAVTSAPPTMAVSTRDYDADLDQSRFHPPTGDFDMNDEDGATTVAASSTVYPSVSLHGSVQQEQGRAGSVVEETPKEVLISNSKASYASLASSDDPREREGDATEVYEEPEQFEETLKDVKKRIKTAKRKRASVKASPPKAPSPSTSDEDEDDVVIISCTSSSSSTGKPPRKKTKVAAKRKAGGGGAKASSEERTSNAADAEVLDHTSATPSTRPKRSKGKGKAATVPTPSPASTSVSASESGSLSAKTSVSSEKESRAARRRTQDEEAIRRVLSLPLETVAHVSKLIGGTASLHRLMAIGEAAKDYFDKLKRSPSH